MTTKTWVVTGAAGGFGRELTVRLLAGGDGVAATDINPGPLADLSEQHGKQQWTAALDVTDTPAIRRVVGEAFDQLGHAEAMNSAVLTVSARPQLLDRSDQPRRAIGNDQPRGLQSALAQITPELKPVLLSLAHSQADRNQRTLAVLGEPPGAQHPLLRSVRTDRQVDRINEQRHQLDLEQIASPEGEEPLVQL